MWFWNYQGHELWFETGQPVRFKVDEVRFRAPPEPLSKNNSAAAGARAGPGAFALPTTPLLEQPMLVVGQATEMGLGMLAWWHQEAADDTDESSQRHTQQ